MELLLVMGVDTCIIALFPFCTRASLRIFNLSNTIMGGGALRECGLYILCGVCVVKFEALAPDFH